MNIQTAVESHSGSSSIRPYYNSRLNYFSLAIALCFLLGVAFFSTYFVPLNQSSFLVIFAAVAGAYMALNIGANDVANNVGPAVGSGALSLWAAVGIAVVFESAGALLAGGDVVSTISKSIIDPSLMSDKAIFVVSMVSALVAGALWLNLATWIGAPVSTTHSIVGGVLGAAIAASGLSVVNWIVMSKIAASWFISPVLGGVIAACFLALLETLVFSKRDMAAASRRWVPMLLGIMASVFTMYLMMKGLKKIWKPDLSIIFFIGVCTFITISASVTPIVKRASERMENRRHGVNKLFTIPLIFSAALLSFAHGANDVANAIGPLSAIISISNSEVISSQVGIPIWVMVIGAVGISLGLALYGAKLIRTVGKKLTTLDQSRAFCVCLSAAITVIGASALGLPVSSTHIAIGAVFGVGLYRESKCRYRLSFLKRTYTYVTNFYARISGRKMTVVIEELSVSGKPRMLVRRRELLTIAAAWFITVPFAALIAAAIFYFFTLISGASSK